MFEQVKLEVYAIAGVVALLSIAGGMAYCHHLGYKSAEVKYQSIITQHQNDALLLQNAIKEQVLEQERNKASELAALAGDYEKKIAEVKHAQTIASNDAVTRGMYVYATCPGQDGLPTTTTSTSGNNVRNKARLSDKTASDLVSLASDCNSVVIKLQACQDIVRSDRK